MLQQDIEEKMLKKLFQLLRKLRNTAFQQVSRHPMELISLKQNTIIMDQNMNQSIKVPPINMNTSGQKMEAISLVEMMNNQKMQKREVIICIF